ncbi:complement resistance protein TraT [Acinetobacter johnsonii]|nr:complement resistance protein TraT [Acinetobacter johnsonii]
MILVQDRLIPDNTSENIGKETVAIAGGAIAGKVILGTIGGIVAGPVGIALAGGLGAYIGGVAGSTGANMLNREKLCDQRDRVVSLLIEFAEWFKIVLLHYRVKQNLLYFQKLKVS